MLRKHSPAKTAVSNIRTVSQLINFIFFMCMSFKLIKSKNKEKKMKKDENILNL
ncbi:Uncharacterized protein dnl_33420 [Desulfonema limicola]|uniref:Uncharacterized protein n=1 Tax=Desulfonema limicola TaxID=45656 RepID=A0A975B992_9BACT|nr:Uncharacterized protein dnl_33420 [Desulfonema limicola]